MGGVLIMGGAVFVIAFLGYIISASRSQPTDEEQRRRRQRRVDQDSGDDPGDTFDDASGVSVADSLMRMADRYDNSGNTQAAEQARAAAEQARGHSDSDGASRAASDYLASIGATDVAGAWSSLDTSSSSGDSPSSSGASDGGSSWSDNS